MVITSSPSSTKPSSKSKIRLPRKPISEGLDISCSLQGADGVDGLLVAVTDHLTTKSAAYAAPTMATQSLWSMLPMVAKVIPINTILLANFSKPTSPPSRSIPLVSPPNTETPKPASFTMVTPLLLQPRPQVFPRSN